MGNDEPATKTELREAMLSVHEDMLDIKKQISDLRETIRNKWWIPVAVSFFATAATAVITIIGVIVSVIVAHWGLR